MVSWINVSAMSGYWCQFKRTVYFLWLNVYIGVGSSYVPNG